VASNFVCDGSPKRITEIRSPLEKKTLAVMITKKQERRETYSGEKIFRRIGIKKAFKFDSAMGGKWEKKSGHEEKEKHRFAPGVIEEEDRYSPRPYNVGLTGA